MKRNTNIPLQIPSIAAMHKLLELPGPGHPLVSVLNLDELPASMSDLETSLSYNFYIISLKRNFEGKIKYGQQYYDFDKGVMTFIAPGQIMAMGGPSGQEKIEGYSLIVHPDFFRSYPLSNRIKEYGYFSYAVSEALHLSEEEEQLIIAMIKNIGREIGHSIDVFSQDLIVSHIDLLLNYCNRFYNRQFITRKIANDQILYKLETLLNTHYQQEEISHNNSLLIRHLATQLNLSPNYLNDLLKSLTGLTTQQHVHQRLIEKAKDMLSKTSLSVSEIAYLLGFEYPQSFNKLFKNKTHLSPSEYRRSLN